MLGRIEAARVIYFNAKANSALERRRYSVAASLGCT